MVVVGHSIPDEISSCFYPQKDKKNLAFSRSKLKREIVRGFLSETIDPRQKLF